MGNRAAVLGLLAAVAAPACADQLCIKAAGGTRTIRIRATGCRPTEIVLGSFDGTTLQLSGINLQIVSGSGATDGPANGRGNLIIGYNENLDAHARSGSHNLVLGVDNGYSAWGGIVSGTANDITGPGAAVVAAIGSASSGDHTLVAGGEDNQATGFRDTVVGGLSNRANGGDSTVCGGMVNRAMAPGAAVAGGYENTAAGYCSTAAGGECNVAGGPGNPACPGVLTGPSGFATVTGGWYNNASGEFSSVSGGTSRSATGDSDWVAGSLFQDN